MQAINKIKIYKHEDHIHPILGDYKKQELSRLINKWIGSLSGKKILKTDLREEAFGQDQVLFSLNQSAEIFGIDISANTVSCADSKQKIKKLEHKYLVADVRQIPFRDNFFDLVLSVSTLDHFFSDKDLEQSLNEISRVLKPGGRLILALNNKSNWNAYAFFKLEQLIKKLDYPIQFYDSRQATIFAKKSGFIVKNQEFIVHLISPFNSIFILADKFMTKELVNRAAEAFIKFSRWLGMRRTKAFTGWFVALECLKSPGNQRNRYV
jgi:ubiquinone/menaquinone biosynthesis C-methylase UbiE